MKKVLCITLTLALLVFNFTSCSSKRSNIIGSSGIDAFSEDESKLNNQNAIDPFENLLVTFDGISPYCTIALNNSKCSEYIQKNVSYSLYSDRINLNDKLSINQTVILYAIARTDNSDTQQYSLSSNQKTYKVENVPKYITEITDDMDLTKFKQEASDYLTSITSWSLWDHGVFDTYRGYFVSSSDLKQHDIYFGALKINVYDQFNTDEKYLTESILCTQ